MTSEDKSEKVKVGFEITKTLDARINRHVEKIGYKDRAEFIRNAIIRECERLESHEAVG